MIDDEQWLLCAAAALSVIVAAEIRKAVLRRPTAAKAIQADGAPPARATTPERQLDA